MLLRFIAWLERQETKLKLFINTLKNQLSNMENEVTSDVVGLRKFAKFNSLTVDGNGNYNLSVTFYYKDGNGNVLNFADTKMSNLIVSGSTSPGIISDSEVDPVIQTSYNAIIASITPILKTLIPNSI